MVVRMKIKSAIKNLYRRKRVSVGFIEAVKNFIDKYEQKQKAEVLVSV